MNLILDPHQETTRDFCVNHPYSIMALDMGLGKTPTSLAVWNKIGRGNCLVICPAYLLLNWEQEIRKFLGKEPIITIIRKGSEIYDAFDSDFVLISYTLSQKAEQLFEWADMVLLDEGQYVHSMKAKRTDFIHRAIYENSVKRLHILTGTPIKNRIEEYYSLIALCNYDPKKEKSEFLSRFPDSITFADYFSHRQEFKMEIRNKWVTIVKWTGVKNGDELKQYLKGHYIRFASDKVLKLDVPVMKDILISNHPDKKLLAEFESHYSNEGNDSVMPTFKAEAALKKVPFTVHYVKDLLEQVDCVAIYSDHVASAEAIAREFNVPAITGKMNPNSRMQLGLDFQAGKSRVIAATIKSFSTGINLTRANNLVLNDYAWVPGDIKQVIHRIQRRGQTKKCVIHRILGSPQDRTILETVESKNQTIEKVV